MRSRRSPTRPHRPPQQLPLSEEEEQTLQRLLSDPTKYPQTLKTWIISWLEGSDLSLPMYSVNGLKDRLSSVAGTNILSGYASGPTDANANIRVNFATPVTSVGGVVVSRQGGKAADPPLTQLPPQVVLSVEGISVTGFNIFAYHIPSLAPYASAQVSAIWIAHVVP